MLGKWAGLFAGNRLSKVSLAARFCLGERWVALRKANDKNATRIRLAKGKDSVYPAGTEEAPMAEVISPQLLKVLTDVTGEVKLDNALRIVTREAIDHRLEHLAAQIRTLEQKYGVAFEQFDQRFQAGEISHQHSYEVEQDYLEWEGLICRQRRLREVREWLQ